MAAIVKASKEHCGDSVWPDHSHFESSPTRLYLRNPDQFSLHCFPTHCEQTKQLKWYGKLYHRTLVPGRLSWNKPDTLQWNEVNFSPDHFISPSVYMTKFVEVYLVFLLPRTVSVNIPPHKPAYTCTRVHAHTHKYLQNNLPSTSFLQHIKTGFYTLCLMHNTSGLVFISWGKIVVEQANTMFPFVLTSWESYSDSHQ